MTVQIDKYLAAELEPKQQNVWQQANIMKYGELKNISDKEGFCIFLPPPNVTGTLHMGHAFNQTIMDILIRHARMNGKDALWVPGMDHAGIATQIVVERQLAQQGIDKNDLSREAFIEKVWAWKEESGSQISEQIRRLGGSLHWDQSYFTMDEKMSAAVIKAFVQLYNDGLIYRGQRLVNWDPSLQTAVSDLEVINQEEAGFLWHISYQVAQVNQQPSNEWITVATTRPETLLGDVAVMVNPEDPRYQHLIGQEVIVPVCGRRIPIIADTYVEIGFGTGAVKVTPAHDFNDYQVARRHHLAPIAIFDNYAKCNQNTPTDYQGLSREEARLKILAALKQNQQLIAEKPHQLMIPRCERTNTIIEPMLTYQWFLDLTQKNQYNAAGELLKKGGLDAITEPALSAINQNDGLNNLNNLNKNNQKKQDEHIEIIPEEWQHTYRHWLNNIQDWCLSRQLVWGHQIPAWHGTDGQIFVAENAQQAQIIAQKAGYTGQLQQDNDVLDTWFSSALVPFASLGWGDKTLSETEQQAILDHFLPSATLVTGYDIIFFWVARMVMLTRYFTGKNPFKSVYVHGLVRDAEGKKMSKSEGNTLDPIDLIDGIDLEKLLEKRTKGLRRPETAPQVVEKTKQAFPNGIPSFGTDALRFTFASLATLGRHINFDAKRCEGYLHFCNKLWNATRFVLMQVNQQIQKAPQLQAMLNEGTSLIELVKTGKIQNLCDRWLVSELEKSITEINQHIKTYRFDLMANASYSLLWETYCDWYVEFSKITLQQNQDVKDIHQMHQTLLVLIDGLQQILKLLHPIMPFMTEELSAAIKPYLPKNNINANINCLAQESYPQENDFAQAANIKNTTENEMAQLKQSIQICRQLRSQMNISPAQKVPLQIYIPANYHQNQQTLDVLEASLPYLKTLAKLERIECIKLAANVEAPVLECASKLGELIFALILEESETEKAQRFEKLKKQSIKMQQELEKCLARLVLPGYVDKAPAHLIEQDKARIQTLEAQIALIEKQLV